MPCNAVTKFEYDACEANLGGVKRVWLANYVEGAAQVSAESGATEGIVTGFTSGVTWQEYKMRKNVASMTSTLNTSTDGAVYVSTVLSMVFNKMEAQKRAAVQALALGECMALVQDSNNKIWFLGMDAPLTSTNGGGETGTAKGDRNAYTVELTDESLEYPHECSDTVLPGADEGE